MGNIGDLLVSTVIFENIEALREYKKITLLIADDYINLFDSYNGQIQLIGLNKKKYKYSFIYKVKIFLSLRNEKYLYAFNLTPARTISDDSLALLSGSKNTLALPLDSKIIIKLFRNHIDKEYSKIVGNEYFNEYEKTYGIIKFLSQSKADKFFNEKTFTIGKLSAITSELPKILIAPFSSDLNRDWTISNYIELIKKLQQDNFIILMSSKSQQFQLKCIIDSIDKKNIYHGRYTFPLEELPQLMANIDLFVGGDSGMTHLALKMNKPFISIIGGGNFGRFFPFKASQKFNYLYHKSDCFNCEWKCYKEKQFCITNVSVETVYSTVERLLSTTKLKSELN